MSRFKHNKKRNTAFLYEALVRELTTSIVSKNNQKKVEVISIVKEHFGPDTVLHQELEIYKSLVDTKYSSRGLAEKVLAEAKTQYTALDKDEVFERQSKLISEINRKLGRGVFSNFVPNYKSLANIYQFLNTSMAPKTKILLENSIVNHLCGDKDTIKENSKVPADNLVLKSFIKNFNETYSSSLYEEQKTLLNKYVASFSDNGLDLKIYLNEEIPRLREALQHGLDSDNISLSESSQNKAQKVICLMDSYHKKEVNTSVVEQVLKIQNLAREMTK